MNLIPNQIFTDSLFAGNGMTIAPSSSATVELFFLGGTTIKESLTFVKRYGPYPADVAFRVTAIGGSCEVNENPIAESLHTEGWDDLRFPAQGINPAGAADAPTVETTLTGYPGTLLFSGSADNIIAGVAQMPHAWKRGSLIYPHIHWSKPVGSANATTWVLYYRILGMPGDVHGELVGPVSATATVGDPATSDSMVITAFGSINLTGQRESTCLAWQIRRLGNTDADSGTARLFEFDIHYQTDKSGTIDEFPSG